MGGRGEGVKRWVEHWVERGRGCARVGLRVQIQQLLMGKGYKEDMVEKCLREYEEIGVWERTADGGVRFIGGDD